MVSAVTTCRKNKRHIGMFALFKYLYLGIQDDLREEKKESPLASPIARIDIVTVYRA